MKSPVVNIVIFQVINLSNIQPTKIDSTRFGWKKNRLYPMILFYVNTELLMSDGRVCMSPDLVLSRPWTLWVLLVRTLDSLHPGPKLKKNLRLLNINNFSALPEKVQIVQLVSWEAFALNLFFLLWAVWVINKANIIMFFSESSFGIYLLVSLIEDW